MLISPDKIIDLIGFILIVFIWLMQRQRAEEVIHESKFQGKLTRVEI